MISRQILKALGPKHRGWIETWLNRREYRKNHVTAQALAAGAELALREKKHPMPEVRHPLHARRLKEYKDQIARLPIGKLLTINFGDSLTDLTREYLTVFDGIYSISGSWSNHMADMAADTRQALKMRPVRTIAVGTLGGNPLLAYEPIQPTIDRAIAALDRIRELYPVAKIVVYGLPPVYNLNATAHSWEFDLAMLRWCQADRNATFASLKSFGRGFLWLRPSFRWSSDGVHFTPRAASKFDQLIRRASNSGAVAVW